MSDQKKTFRYEAMDGTGYAVFGEVQAVSKDDAVAEIRKLELWTTWVREEKMEAQTLRQSSRVELVFRLLKFILPKSVSRNLMFQSTCLS